MKKSLLVLTAALAFGMAAAQDTAPAAQVPALTDVPAGHWAKDAIDSLVSQGIILGYPDGTYRGTQNLTRYEAAVIIARLLNQMGTGEAPPIDPATLTLLQNAIQELAADLAALGVRVSDLEANAVTKDDFSRLEQRVEELGSATAPVDNGNADAITELQGQISDFNTRADELQSNYDALRADVDDNASSIAALNDLTVLLNQDILDLQDRASAIEAAQADFVQRADFDNLSGRVGAVETKVTDFGNRIAALEKNAFSIKPTLTATYFVARADRDMDIDRLFAGTKFSSGDDGDADTKDTAVDYTDLTGDRVKVTNDAGSLYGFSTNQRTYRATLIKPAVAATPTAPAVPAETKVVTFNAPVGATTFTPTPADTGAGFVLDPASIADIGPAGVNKEGQTTLDFGIDFTTTGGVTEGKSVNTGAYLTSAGGVAVKSVDIKFGITTDPSLTGTQTDAGLARYPALTDDNQYTYRPLFFYFKNGTATFTVGNSPVTVDFGRALKTKFGDYVFDNDKNGRGDGYVVTVDGANVPIIGAFKPIIKVVYGSSRLGYNADGTTNYAGDVQNPDGTGTSTSGRNGDYRYYRGIRAEVTPIGTLKLGLNFAEEALDAVGYKLGVQGVRDVLAYGADAHGALFGFQVDSEYAHSRVQGAYNTTDLLERTANAFYGRVSGAVGPVTIYDANFRSIDGGFDKFADISEANPKDGDNGSAAPFNRGDRTDPTGAGVANGQRGGAIKLGATVGPFSAIGPISLGGYYDRQTSTDDTAGTDASTIVDYGVAAKVAAFNLVTVRGGYYFFSAGATSADIDNQGKGAADRYNVRADVTPGFGLSVGGFYRNINLNGTKSQDDVVAYANGPDNTDTASLFQNSRYGSYYTLADNKLTDASGCGPQNPGTGLTDTDAVGGALTFSLGAFDDETCYSEFGAEIQHDGKSDTALVKNLDLRFGYAQRYRNATDSYSANVLYADALYGSKLGPLNVNVKALFNQRNFDQTVETTQSNIRTFAGGARVTSDPFNIIFKPSLEAQAGYLSRNRSGSSVAADNYDSTGLSYRAGVKLDDFLLPTAKLAVYYAGLRTTNRAYTPWDNADDNNAGSYGDANNGATINQTGLYVEGNYYDLSFAYGNYSLSAVDAGGVETALPTGVAAKGSTFKITYKVAF